MLERFTGVAVSAATAQRQTEVVGRVAEALQQAEVERIEDDLPPALPGPARALLSVDGNGTAAAWGVGRDQDAGGRRGRGPAPPPAAPDAESGAAVGESRTEALSILAADRC